MTCISFEGRTYWPQLPCVSPCTTRCCLWTLATRRRDRRGNNCCQVAYGELRRMTWLVQTWNTLCLPLSWLPRRTGTWNSLNWPCHQLRPKRIDPHQTSRYFCRLPSHSPQTSWKRATWCLGSWTQRTVWWICKRVCAGFAETWQRLRYTKSVIQRSAQMQIESIDLLTCLSSLINLGNFQCSLSWSSIFCKSFSVGGFQSLKQVKFLSNFLSSPAFVARRLTTIIKG